MLAGDLNPVEVATAYATHGAHAVSVLTDEKYFRGASTICGRSAARWTSRCSARTSRSTSTSSGNRGPRAPTPVLLIVSILEPAQLSDLLAAAKGLGLAALVECHTAAELDQALAAGSRIVGINNRDLATFETRLETTLELVPSIPPGPIVVSESGFFTGADVRRVVAAGAHAVLIGEALVRSGDVGGQAPRADLDGS